MRVLTLAPLLAVFSGVFAQGGDGMDDRRIIEALASKGFKTDILDGSIDVGSLLRQQGSCPTACKALSIAYGDDSIILPSSLAYDGWTQYRYWSSQQAEVDPSCVFIPSTNTDVSIVVLLSRLTNCPFAVTSGGHAAFAGASNSKGGITVNLKKLTKIELAEDGKIAHIQPGNRWGDVYSFLDPKGVTVVGGRAADVGVGGLTTGGGISFFSNRRGWACDNVESYELVTAKGDIINVTKTSHPDLFWGLRGGGNNFGIVTEFSFNSFPQGLMWGGSRIYLEADLEGALDSFVNFGRNSPSDPDAHSYLVIARSNGSSFVLTELEHTTPVNPTAMPKIFEEFMALPAVADTTANRTLHELTVNINSSSPYYLRNMYSTITYRLSAELTSFSAQLCLETFASLDDIAAILPCCVYQHISEGVLGNMAKNGGNPLGLSAEDGPYMILLIPVMWAGATDDARVYQAADAIQTKVLEKAKELGLYEDYIYMNYASQYQDVVASYGPENKARLKEVAAKYDPAAVFQRLQPGYFKLDGAPVEG